MHDIDQMMLESNEGYEEEFEYEEEGEAFEEEAGEDRILNEEEELEAASNLLTVSNEEELEQFLGSLFKKVGRAVKSVVKSPVGKVLGGLLKNVAKKALPVLGAAAGNLIAPGVGGVIGGNLAAGAGKMFGLELEGLTPEDAEFEVARRYVRLASLAAAKAARSPQAGPPHRIARTAILSAARRVAPGLIGRPLPAYGPVPRYGYGPGYGFDGRNSGRWIRRGRKIILFGV